MCLEVGTTKIEGNRNIIFVMCEPEKTQQNWIYDQQVFLFFPSSLLIGHLLLIVVAELSVEERTFSRSMFDCSRGYERRFSCMWYEQCQSTMDIQSGSTTVRLIQMTNQSKGYSSLPLPNIGFSSCLLIDESLLLLFEIVLHVISLSSVSRPSFLVEKEKQKKFPVDSLLFCRHDQTKHSTEKERERQNKTTISRCPWTTTKLFFCWFRWLTTTASKNVRRTFFDFVPFRINRRKGNHRGQSGLGSETFLAAISSPLS